jgi:hypothetical protein
MKKKTLDALKGSIRKWEQIRDGLIEDQGTHNCPLCKLFHAFECVGCPIQQHTGQKGCVGSPYEAYNDIYFDDGDDEDSNPEHKKKLAQDELDFLISLLPKSPNQQEDCNEPS